MYFSISSLCRRKRPNGMVSGAGRFESFWRRSHLRTAHGSCPLSLLTSYPMSVRPRCIASCSREARYVISYTARCLYSRTGSSTEGRSQTAAVTAAAAAEEEEAG